MMSKIKYPRILTNRNFPDGESWEAIEIRNDVFFWLGEDEVCKVGFGFPVDEEFVIEKFKEVGRVYVPQ